MIKVILRIASSAEVKKLNIFPYTHTHVKSRQLLNYTFNGILFVIVVLHYFESKQNIFAHTTIVYRVEI
jgi:hypothetical protein